MKESKYRHNNITELPGCYQDSNSLKKWCNWIQTRMYGPQHRFYNAQLERADHIVSRLHEGIYTRNRRFIKPDLTEAAPPEPEPRLRPLLPKPSRTIKRPDRLIKSK